MKSLLFIFALALSASAQAASVGDTATYSATTQGFTLNMNLTVTAVDANSGTATVHEVTSYNGMSMQESDSVKTFAEVDGLSAAQLALCPSFSQNGSTATLETMTVPAGTFMVCHVKSNSDGNSVDSYLGTVPFGLIKVVSVGTTNLTLELISYKKN